MGPELRQHPSSALLLFPDFSGKDLNVQPASQMWCDLAPLMKMSNILQFPVLKLEHSSRVTIQLHSQKTSCGPLKGFSLYYFNPPVTVHLDSLQFALQVCVTPWSEYSTGHPPIWIRLTPLSGMCSMAFSAPWNPFCFCDLGAISWQCMLMPPWCACSYGNRWTIAWYLGPLVGELWISVIIFFFFFLISSLCKCLIKLLIS